MGTEGSRDREQLMLRLQSRPISLALYRRVSSLKLPCIGEKVLVSQAGDSSRPLP